MSALCFYFILYVLVPIFHNRYYVFLIINSTHKLKPKPVG
ncbi:putative membrane protein [Anaplasma phagocytophilum str. Annie]|nr:putative membrane protein [Anaplasma phagocytophilum str. Annie]